MMTRLLAATLWAELTADPHEGAAACTLAAESALMRRFRALKVVALCWAPVFLVIGVARILGGVEAANVAGWVCGGVGLCVGVVLAVRAWRTHRADMRAFDKLLG